MSVTAASGCFPNSAGISAVAKPQPQTQPVSGSISIYSANAYEIEPGANQVELFALAGEVVGVRLDISDRGQLDVQVSDLVGRSGGRMTNNVTRYRLHPVDVAYWPSWHLKHVSPQRRQPRVYDVLVPASAPKGGLPASTGSDPLVTWLDIAIPSDAPADRYAGQIVVLRGDQPLRRVAVNLTVLASQAVGDHGPHFSADIDHRRLFRHHVRFEGRPFAAERIFETHPASDKLTRVLDHTMRLLRSYGVSGQLPWLYPVLKINASQAVVTDWSDFDAAAGSYISGDAYDDATGSPLWKMPLDGTFPRPPRYGSLSSPLYSRHVAGYVAQMSDHFAKQGWLDRACIVLPHGRLDDPIAQEAAEHFGYLIRRVNPNVTLMSTLMPQDVAGSGWYGFEHLDLASFVDVWNSPAQFFDKSAIAADFASRSWLMVDRPPFSGSIEIAADPSDTEVVAWQGRATESDAVDLGLINPWPDVERPDPQSCVDHHSRALLYPGRAFGLDHPIASVRLARIRRSRFDLRYLEALLANGQADLAVRLQRMMVTRVGTEAYGVHFADGRANSYQRDPQIWAQARRVMADALGGASGGDARAALRRRRLFADASRVDATVTGFRLRVRGDGADAYAEAECAVQIDNRTESVISGELRFAALPPGWSGTLDGRRVESIAPGSSRRISLSARVGSVPGGADGLVQLPLEFAIDDGDRVAISARLCHLLPARASGSIHVDGDLSDWPIGAGNFGSGFQLIHAPDPSVENDDRNPRNPTTVSVSYDDTHLYFAVRCAQGSREDGSRPPVIEDLIPRGAELVEILIDPSNIGDYLPSNTYRVAVRQRGVEFSKGIETFPPVGSYQNWSANGRYGVKVKRDHWTAEVSIPLASFSDRDLAGPIWGVNFTRFDLANQAYSTWSGAIGTAYNPHSLGNMTFPLSTRGTVVGD